MTWHRSQLKKKNLGKNITELTVKHDDFLEWSLSDYKLRFSQIMQQLLGSGGFIIIITIWGLTLALIVRSFPRQYEMSNFPKT